MRTAGMICECNPFHQGHEYLISQARASGVDAVVCVMSGFFTQRGEPALFEPRTRAICLRAGGADAVVELPVPYSLAGAEFFASAGISILSRLCVDEVWFGSECGDLGLLSRAAEIVTSQDFFDRYRALCLTESGGAASLYLQLLQEMGLGETSLSSNDLLGVAYLAAIRRSGSKLQAHTVKRCGSGFSELALRKGCFPSASGLRRVFAEQGLSAWEHWMTAAQLQVLQSSLESGLSPASFFAGERAVFGFLRMSEPEALERVPELSGGLGRRILRLAKTVVCLSELIHGAVTKKYTEARVRRGILFAMLGVTESDLRTPPAYAVLLSANQIGCRFLAQNRKSASIPMVSTHSKIPADAAAQRQEQLTERACALYSLFVKEPVSPERYLRRSADILTD